MRLGIFLCMTCLKKCYSRKIDGLNYSRPSIFYVLFGIISLREVLWTNVLIIFRRQMSLNHSIISLSDPLLVVHENFFQILMFITFSLQRKLIHDAMFTSIANGYQSNQVLI